MVIHSGNQQAQKSFSNVSKYMLQTFLFPNSIHDLDSEPKSKNDPR